MHTTGHVYTHHPRCTRMYRVIWHIQGQGESEGKRQREREDEAGREVKG
jgi:hypothetical protein